VQLIVVKPEAKGWFLMIAQFTDSVAGTAVYINPAYVMTLRRDPDDPEKVTMAPGRRIGPHSR
jgi:hypothetical protein